MIIEISESEAKTLLYCLKQEKITVAGLIALGFRENGTMKNIENIISKVEMEVV